MDLKVNNVGFQGKKEYLYGLSKAANNVRSYSMYTQPRLLRLGENPNIQKYEASAKAYLDLLTIDYRFWNYVHDFKPKDLKIIKSYLEPQENLGVNPLEHFGKFLADVMEHNGTAASDYKNHAEYLLDILT